MKYKHIQIILSLCLFCISCLPLKKTKPTKYEYFYYSHTHYLRIKNHIEAGIHPSPNFATVDGIEFTCKCEPEYVQKVYSITYPDVVLVKKLPDGKGKLQIHY